MNPANFFDSSSTVTPFQIRQQTAATTTKTAAKNDEPPPSKTADVNGVEKSKPVNENSEVETDVKESQDATKKPKKKEGKHCFNFYCCSI